MRINVRNLNTSRRLNSLQDIVDTLIQTEFTINLVIILCPIFNKGHLKESSLMSEYDVSIKNSRINSKWVKTVNLINLLSEKAKQRGIPLHIDFLFADNGTLINRFTEHHHKILIEHESIWRDEIKKIEKEAGISVSFTNFSEIAPEVPEFVNINKSEFLNQNRIDKKNIRLDFIKKVNKQLELWFKESSECPIVGINRKNKKRVSRLLSVLDLDSAFVMCTTYLGKRFRLPKQFKGSVFVWFERMDVLLVVDDMLEEFKNTKKVMVKV
jgi:hypothetical protein